MTGSDFQQQAGFGAAGVTFLQKELAYPTESSSIYKQIFFLEIWKFGAHNK